MYDEMRFLFNIDPTIANKSNDNNNNKIKNNNNPIQAIEYKNEYDPEKKDIYLNTYTVTKNDVKNFIKSDVNKAYQATKKNPYLQLLEDFNAPGSPKSLRIKSSDLAHLRDIGVMPLNRLVILRRYPEGVIVPKDLNDLDIEPISTVIGWVKADSNMLDFSFNEKWEKIGSDKMLHKLLRNIINDEFGVDVGGIIPVPGWGQGFLFGIMNRMGLTNYNSTNLPIGDPNVLKEAITRPHEEFGLNSAFDFELETVFEPKYLAGVDLTVTTMDIINNLLTMGTSDTRFLGRKDSRIIQMLRSANENPTGGSGWAKLSGYVVKSFINAIQDTLKSEVSKFNSIIQDDNKGLIEAKNNQEGTNDQESEKDKKNKKSKLKQVNPEVELSVIGDSFLNSGFIRSILASTIARYQWPIRGSVSMFTGDSNTPWHLTVGNPYSPLLSMNDIHVKDVSVSGGKDMAYTDLPKDFNIKISMSQGRSLGKNEINDLFGITYKRQYKKNNG